MKLGNGMVQKTLNPFNIRNCGLNNWKGQTGSYKGFCVFVRPEWGIRAAYRVLMSYEKRDITRLDRIIETFAPRSENNTDVYILELCKRLGVNHDFDFANKTFSIYCLLSEMAWIESCTKISPEEIDKILIELGC